MKLIAKKMFSALSEGEQRELDEWIACSEQNHQFYNQFTSSANVSKILNDRKNLNTNASWKRFEKDYLQPAGMAKKKSPVVKYVTVATAAVIVGIALWMYIFLPEKVDKVIPTGSVLIKRADGTVISLDSAKDGGVLAGSDNTIIRKVGKNKISYTQQGDASSAEITYDEIITSTGGECEVTLADGSKMWINAKSIVRYPAVINYQPRQVQLEGEADFEVSSLVGADRKKIPFVVNASELQVTVLGTHFNIMAYSNEPNKVASLYEGSVNVLFRKLNKTLKPGEQAIVNSQGELTIRRPADISTAIEWKNGQMYFDDSPLDSIMRQVSRWYDMEFECDGNGSVRFTTILKKKDSLQTFLQGLENTKDVRFEIRGKKIIARR